MRYSLFLCVLLLAGCPSEPTKPVVGSEPTAQPATRIASKIVILLYSKADDKVAEEARLNRLLDEGWRVVSTDTKSATKKTMKALDGDIEQHTVEWTITVTLEREVPVN